MCQLTYIRCKDQEILKLAISLQGLINTQKKHKDGFGIFSKKLGIKKQDKPPSEWEKYGETIDSIKNEQIIAHCRLATYTNGSKKITSEKAHPFESESLIFAHNGSLELYDKNWKDNKEYESLIDSEIFLLELEKEYRKRKYKNFPGTLSDVMKLFHGKFAFMIYNKIEDVFYIVRGKTAELWTTDIIENGKAIGVIINTEEDDLKSSTSLLKILGKSIYSKNLSFENPKYLGSESIYYVNEKFKFINVGKIEENKSPITVYNGRNRKHINQAELAYYTRYGHYPEYYDDDDEIYDYKKGGFVKKEKISDFVNKKKLAIAIRSINLWGKELALGGLDDLCYVVFGRNIAQLEHDDLIVLYRIVEYLDNNKMFQSKLDIWKNIVNKLEHKNIEMFMKKYELQFPFMLNYETVLKKVEEKL